MTDHLQEVLEDYAEARLREEMKPYWLNLRGGTTYSGELRFEEEHYFPEAHYNIALAEELERRLLADGGSTHLHTDGRRNSVYYWLNPDTGAALYHTEANDTEADPFFASVEEAEAYLESRDTSGDEDLNGLSLYKARVQKVEDAVEVLMDQAGIGDF